jgi:hypothetical protein
MPPCNRAPDWGFWVHVPSVTLHEGVALSLNIDPKRLRRPTGRAIIAGKRYDEGPDFDRRLELSKRCLGDSLPGPENGVVVWYFEDEARVRLRNFASWGRSIGWSLPQELEQLGAREDAAVMFRHFRGPVAPDPVQELEGTKAVVKPAQGSSTIKDEDADVRSGFQGRPGNSKHLIEDEFRRRMTTAQASHSLADEAAALLAWLEKTHPRSARPTLKTIENNIRIDHRRWKMSLEAERS